LKPYIAAMVEEAPNDPHHFAVRQLADYPNDSFLLVHRAGDGQVEWHETQEDVFLVQSGSATLVVGGQLVNRETVEPQRQLGRSAYLSSRFFGSRPSLFSFAAQSIWCSTFSRCVSGEGQLS
jgi:hypothetical protein